MNYMENIYSTTIEMVNQGSKFQIDLKNKHLKIGKKYLIFNGEIICNLPTGIDPYMSQESIISEIESLYKRYKHSRPTERSMSKRRTYFTALPERKLDDEDFMFGQSRDVCQLELELFVLLISVSKMFKWDDDKYGKWFWQQSEDKDLVILKEWIV